MIYLNLHPALLPSNSIPLSDNYVLGPGDKLEVIFTVAKIRIETIKEMVLLSFRDWAY